MSCTFNRHGDDTFAIAALFRLFYLAKLLVKALAPPWPPSRPHRRRLVRTCRQCHPKWEGRVLRNLSDGVIVIHLEVPSHVTTNHRLPSSTMNPSMQADEANAVPVEQWIQAYGPSVLHFAYSRLGQRSEAEDVFQEVFVRAFRSQSLLKDPGKVKAWLLTVTANLCRDRMRWWKRQLQRVATHAIPEAPDPSGNPAASVIAHEEHQELFRQILALAATDRDVIILHYLDDLSLREIAKVLTCTEQVVKSRLHRARVHLRQRIAQKEGLVDDR